MGGQRTCGRPSLEEHFTAYMRTKHAAQHIEHSSQRDSVDDASGQPVKTTCGATSKPVDSVMEKSAPASTTSNDSNVFTQAGARSSTDSTFKPPSPLRNYREEPKLWVDYEHEGGQAGKAIAEWKEKFVPLIHEVTEDMTIAERTEFFDKLIKEDPDRYLQPLGAYYIFYPDHIPDREASEKQRKKIEEGMNELPPHMAAAQKRVFPGYFNGDWSWDPSRPRIPLKPDLGPRNERTPDDDFGTCQHCTSQTRKGKAIKMVEPVMAPVRAIQRRLSKRVRPESHSSEALHETSDEDDEGSSEDSKDSKPRDITETGVGMRTPMTAPSRRRGRKVDPA